MNIDNGLKESPNSATSFISIFFDASSSEVPFEAGGGAFTSIILPFAATTINSVLLLLRHATVFGFEFSGKVATPTTRIFSSALGFLLLYVILVTNERKLAFQIAILPSTPALINTGTGPPATKQLA